MNSEPLYDVDLALRRLANERTKANPLTTETVRVADHLATHLRRHFDDEAANVAGRALVIAAASVGTICHPHIPTEVVVNVVAFAGQQLTITTEIDLTDSGGGDSGGG